MSQPVVPLSSAASMPLTHTMTPSAAAAAASPAHSFFSFLSTLAHLPLSILGMSGSNDAAQRHAHTNKMYGHLSFDI